MSVSNAKFEKSDHEFYLIFSVNLGDHKRRKVTEPDFLEKLLFGPNLGICAQNGPKIKFFKVWQKSKPLLVCTFFAENYRSNGPLTF